MILCETCVFIWEMLGQSNPWCSTSTDNLLYLLVIENEERQALQQRNAREQANLRSHHFMLLITCIMVQVSAHVSIVAH